MIGIHLPPVLMVLQITVLNQHADEFLDKVRIPLTLLHNGSAQRGRYFHLGQEFAFARQVEQYVDMKGVVVVSASEVRDWVDSGQMPSGSYLLFTFDDGYQNVFNAAAILQQAGFPGVVFVATAFLDKPAFTHNLYDVWISN